ncbi:helix-turn-helix domain-containing protein [Saccharopolyspora sp. K220]|uniref:helix-turn-helix domain-containing protein n=1 Tax=Saccharopolyspora soli TaxID=2926618 RepID=UPI001F55F195|nr:helix-turn-helix transcriptional regulator [Saccharopolyspora soli]MCI2423467.1 helix-turn-helix domain-containing protein [Saccharopolyspora soli]
MATPTVRRLQLGNELRHLRELANETIENAAKIVERTTSTISRLELGQTALTQRQLGDLLDFYRGKISNCEDTAWVLDLAKGNEQRGRWSGYRSVYAKHFRMAVDLERDASAIHWYQTELVSGLLQTEAYMRSLFVDAEVRPVDQGIDDAIKARLERQTILTTENPPDVGFVLSESALRRVVGSRDVMRDQITHLIKCAELPNVQMQVIPFEARTPVAPVYNFTTYRVPSPGQAGPLEFVYVEEYTDGRYLDHPSDVDAYATLWNRLVGAALDPMASRDLLRRVAEEYDAT